MMLKNRATFAVVMALALASFCFAAANVKTASAAPLTANMDVALAAPFSLFAGPREGSGGNSVVCNGVPTRAILMYYANGGVDACGHHDIKAIWAAMGITAQVAKSMHSGTVCSSGGFTSSGRHHSPNANLDRAVIAGGSLVYFRPLSVWGSACYSAWVGHTEDGRTVAVLKGCGNGETTHVPPKHPSPKPKKPKSPVVPPGSCNITINGNNVVINGDINNCSKVTTTVICGNVSRTFTGPNSKEEAMNWQQVNCNTPVPPVLPPVIVPPVIPPIVVPPPVNHAPTGTIKPPPHIIVSLVGKPASTAPACIGNIADADNDQVSVSFTFSAGTWGPVFTDSGGNKCVIFNAPTTVQQVTMYITLTDNASARDSRLQNGSTTYTANFPVVPDINP